MYGYPKTIATKHDVGAMMSYLDSKWATQENKARGLNFLNSLIGGCKSYFYDKNLAADEEPTGPAPDYLVLEQEDGTRRQLKLADDPNARIYRMGYTLAEIEALIATIQEGGE